MRGRNRQGDTFLFVYLFVEGDGPSYTRCVRACGGGGYQVYLQIGMETGTVVETILGRWMLPRGKLFGDTVNMASRMKRHSAACRLNIGPAAARACYAPVESHGTAFDDASAAALVAQDSFVPPADPGVVDSRLERSFGVLVTRRAPVEVKGKGYVDMFWVDVAPSTPASTHSSVGVDDAGAKGVGMDGRRTTELLSRSVAGVINEMTDSFRIRAMESMVLQTPHAATVTAAPDTATSADGGGGLHRRVLERRPSTDAANMAWARTVEPESSSPGPAFFERQTSSWIAGIGRVLRSVQGGDAEVEMNTRRYSVYHASSAPEDEDAKLISGSAMQKVRVHGALQGWARERE